jgi:hypothetical protein
MIGGATVIDDHLNRGRSKDTRGRASADSRVDAVIGGTVAPAREAQEQRP